MPELLLEILSEEIPARMQVRAADDLKRLVTEGLKAAGLAFDNPRTFVTPRRLTFVADGIPDATPDISEERRGPRADAPEKAIEGFKGSLPDGTAIEERETPKGMFLFANVEKKGEPAGEVIGAMLGEILSQFPWPKSMRWGIGQLRWVRPLHRASFLFAGEVTLLHAFGTAASAEEADREHFVTYGHRFLAPDAIAVTDFADYEAKLRKAFVLIDRDERKQVIRDAADKLAAEAGLVLRDDPGLLDEVAGLVEWPVALLGAIDDDYMDLPPEVLVTTMRANQKYFVCEDKDGNLASRFVVVSNTTAAPDTVVAGNERVLRARLADARFFWDTDRANTLASRAPALKDRVFHARLGTLDDKADRLQALATGLATFVPDADKDKVRSAARLAKCDLSTGMVGEFPELQGVMGRYYAINDGESPEVADAIAEHYSPLGPNDACPTKSVSVCVALADKLDTLVGFFGIDEKPTGSKDPYALRRAALGVIRLVVENRIRMPLLETLAGAARLYDKALGVDDTSGELLAFFADRLKVHLREQGVRHDLVDAVYATGGEDDLVRLLARVEALKDFLDTDDGANVLAAYRRAVNILRIEEKKDGASYDGDVTADLLDDGPETELFDVLVEAESQISQDLASEDFVGAMGRLATVRPKVDAFFDGVTVNADDAAKRENRLRMLSYVRRALGPIADFSKIEG
ncbi:MAG: glycine--tRNA ligase subunit beta [Rhodospirillales bacterium]